MALTHSGDGGRSWVLLSAYALAALLTATYISLSFALGWSLIDRARSDAASMAAALEQYVQRTLEVSAVVSEQARDFLAGRPGLEALSADAAAHAEFNGLSKRLDFRTPMTFVNAQGRVVVRSDEFPARGIDLSDRLWFREVSRPGREFVVGEAIMGRIVKRPIFTYSEALRGPMGDFLGAVNLAIPSDVVIGPGSWKGYGNDVGLTVVRQDGLIVARNVLPQTLIGNPYGVMEREYNGRWTRIAQRVFDGSYAVVSSVGLPKYGLVVRASIPLASVLAPLGYILGIGLPLLIMAVAGTMYLTRAALRSYDDLARVAEENSVLFQEVHHRVKNNLQIISSLLQQQSRTASPEAAQGLHEATARIRAMALVHEQIYSGAHPTDVELVDYLKRLANTLHQTYGARGLRLEYDLEPVSVTVNQAIPIALITTEALSNALKHAFPRGTGTICVKLRETGGRVRLEVADDGVGLPENVQHNLGMTVIRGLSVQLGASYGFERGKGTIFWLQWPEAEETQALAEEVIRTRSAAVSG